MQLGLRASVRAGASITSLSIEEVAGHKQLVIVCGDVLKRFDLRSLSEPRLIDERTFEGLRGVGSTGRRLLAFGELGIVDVTAQKTFALAHGPVLAAVVLGDRVVAASPDALTFYDGNFAVRRRVPIGQVTALVSTGRCVAAAVAGRAVEVFERRGDHLDRAGSLAIDCRAGIAAADGFGGRAALFVRGFVGGRVLELGNQGRLQGSRLIGACRGDCGPACCGSPHHRLRASLLQFRG